MAKYNSKKAYGDCEGPFGFPMPSAIAREVEEIYKGLPQAVRDLGYMKRAAPALALDIKEGERADISLVTSDAVDRDREVMLPQGGDWKQFKKNPVVTFAHRYDQLPVGRSLWVKRVAEDTMNGWLAKTQYTTRPQEWEGSWFADAVWHFVKSGDMPGKSIGFLPMEASEPQEKEVEARPELAGVGLIIRKWLALEYAIAPVPSNPDAFVIAAGKAKESGLDIPGCIFDEAGLMIPMGTPVFDKFYEEIGQKPAAETDEYIRMRVEGVIAEPPVIQSAARRIITRETLIREIQGLNISQLIRESLDTRRGRV